MYRLWGKIITKNEIKESYVSAIDEPSMDEAEKLKVAVADICQHFDIQIPIWLQDHQLDILRYSKTAFKEDHFIETINYDYLEIEIIEVDK
ncbi:MAG: hypothetical protein PF505_12510 [Vallitaleaceae bacterium]|jgi:hypothetical protein|nr:hypothetical protein [Vallitaleaceae bacterium]